MRDPHFNIFHSYRGPSVDEVAAARQLENNLTRALLVTLDQLRASPARFELLRILGFDDKSLDQHYQLQMQVQRVGPDWPGPTNRRLIVIHGGSQLRVLDTPSMGRSGRPDAVVYTGESLVAIESKVDNVVSRDQLRRHAQSLNLLKDDVLDTTWSDIARSVRTIPENQRGTHIAAFVLDQFEEYLGMNGYGGLAHEHFSYFAHLPDQRDPLVKAGIRRALSEIGTMIVEETGTSWRQHVLSVRDDAPSSGVLILPDSPKKEPHLTIGIDVSGLLIMANVELQHAHSSFMRAWQKNSQGLIQILRVLGSLPVASPDDVPWRFRTLRRLPLGPPRKFHYWTASDVALSTMLDWRDEDVHSFVDSMVRKPAAEAVPEITLTRSYTIPQVLRTEEINRRLRDDALQLGPFFEWIGRPFVSDAV